MTSHSTTKSSSMQHPQKHVLSKELDLAKQGSYSDSINKGADLWHFWCPVYIWNPHLFMAPGEDANSGMSL